MTHRFFYSLLLFIFCSCGVVPQLEGTYTSAVKENTLYFESEEYHFDGDRFTYLFSTDVAGDNKQGQGSFKQHRYNTKFTFDNEPSRVATKAAIIKSSPKPFTFEIDIRVKAGKKALLGANIHLFKEVDTGSTYTSTDAQGRGKLVLAKDQNFPLDLRVTYLGFEPYVLRIKKPENMRIDVVLQPSIDHLITSVTQEKDIRRKGSYIYINGKKFKKRTP